ncbi:enoyl-CoA hydratase/isomerase family protein [Alteribacillus iranensis]|uniref:2-(1,2-epoxy-1,2-dihydrophenyl)acetyl-CoA isomerase n=1 Tax=Alteribacillus iranensis TaxID=930128 RepID=A0A1I2CTZ6_9BACI|nr:enoyl-CoA hydratase-related protein [Alteribacillus iranensis]SFE71253.1 2-(1,2-epoxy-1,2-dihydrophenyl)acetyl-CoA isomerase [Alteribacillus iranensis]
MKDHYHTIEYYVENKVATIRLNRPEAFNAFTAEMNKEIIDALRYAEKDRDARCIVMTGAGKGFCAGEDLGGVDENTNHADFLRKRYHPMVKAIKNTSKPIVAAVNGTAAGAGMSLALAADFRLMSADAKFISAFTNIGLLPDSGFLYMLPRIVGYAKAMEIAVLGKPIHAKDAYEIGLVTEVYEPSEWDEKVKEFVTSLAQIPPKSFSLIKRYLLDSMHEPFSHFLEKEAQAQRIAGLTKDHIEGLNAFKERRKPEFMGE